MTQGLNCSSDLRRAAIFSGHFPPGAPLREVELAERLGVSRGSVREGLARLEHEGLVRGGWHRGTTVIRVTAEDAQEVYALRAALDRLAATTARNALTHIRGTLSYLTIVPPNGPTADRPLTANG